MKQRIRTRVSVRMSLKHVIWVSSLVVALLTVGIIFLFNITNVPSVRAAVTGDYRTRQSGNWSATSTWQKFNGISWANATATPSSADGAIEILSGHTVTVTTSVTIDQTIIDAGGAVIINSAKSLNEANGTGTDLTVNGTLTINSGGTLSQNASSTINVGGLLIASSGSTHTINAGATDTIVSGGRYRDDGGTLTTTSGHWIVNSGGTFQENKDGGTIPLATWNSGSTCEVTGITATVPVNLGQSFDSFTWNCTGETSDINLAGALTTINGNFNVYNTGTTSSLFLTNVTLYTLTIGGDLTIGSGVSRAVLDLELGGVEPTVNIAGNMSVGSSGSFERSGTGVAPVVCFNKANGIQTLSSSNTAGLNANGRFDWRVGTGSTTNTLQLLSNITLSNLNNLPNGVTVYSGGTLDCGTYTLSGPNATFNINSGAAIYTANTGGLTTTGTTGSIRVTGGITYSTGADYTYNGSSAQITGSGLPSTVHDLIINNSTGVTLTNTTSVSHVLSMKTGQLITGANEIKTTSTSTSSLTNYSSASYIVGNLRRSVSASGSYDFPLGTMANYELINITLSSITGFANILGTFVNANPINPSYPLVGLYISGTAITDMLDYGYWTLTPNTSITGGTYSVTLNEAGQTNAGALAGSHCVLKRTSAASSWQSLGTHNNATQSISGGVVSATRTAISSFSHYGIGKGGGVFPIELTYFNADLKENHVALSWATASELNNDYFTVERSTDGMHFDEVFRKPGAGNSTTTLYYSGEDESPLPGYSYYRLKQTDYDGHFTYSQIKTVKYKTSEVESGLQIISIAPNPFSEKFSTSFMLKKAADVDFQLINSSGQVVFKDVIHSTDGMNQYNFIDEAGLPHGIYFVNLIYNDTKNCQKVIKN